MILGILSDTHGRSKIAKLAVKLLIDNGAKHLIHCGDVGSHGVLDAMAGHPAMFVFGNCDDDRDDLAKYARALNITCGGTHGQLAAGDKKISVTHGDDDRLVDQLIEQQQIDYLFVGHTHELLDQRRGKTRIINPGALHRAATKTVALLDTDSDQLRIVTVK